MVLKCFYKKPNTRPQTAITRYEVEPFDHPSIFFATNTEKQI